MIQTPNPGRAVAVLHVEDNAAHRRYLAELVAGVRTFAVAVTQADTEDQAVAVFRAGQFDVVLLDCHLTGGSGLACLRRLRELDPVVPIVALSGTASADVAASLLEVGADDYLSKRDLTVESLTRCLSAILSRTDLCRQAPTGPAPDQMARLERTLTEACRLLAQRVGPDLTRALDEFEQSARDTKLPARELPGLFDAACRHLENPAAPRPALDRLVRPVLLEALLRLYGQFPTDHRA